MFVPKWYEWIWLAPMVGCLFFYFVFLRNEPENAIVEDSGTKFATACRSWGWHSANLKNFLRSIFMLYPWEMQGSELTADGFRIPIAVPLAESAARIDPAPGPNLTACQGPRCDCNSEIDLGAGVCIGADHLIAKQGACGPAVAQLMYGGK